MEKFDYVILSENNEWLSTGKQETQKELDAEIARLKSEDPDVELVVVQAKSFEIYNV
jgi:hypothetical protein